MRRPFLPNQVDSTYVSSPAEGSLRLSARDSVPTQSKYHATLNVYVDENFPNQSFTTRFPPTYVLGPHEMFGSREEESFTAVESEYAQRGSSRRLGRVVEERVLPPRVVGVHEGRPSGADIRELGRQVIGEQFFRGEQRVIEQRESHLRRSEARSLRVEAPEIETVTREKLFEVVREVPVAVERVVDVPVDVFVDVPIERLVETERVHEIYVERPYERLITIPVEEIVEVPIEKTIEVPVEHKRYYQRPYETLVPRPYEVTLENVIFDERVIDVDEADVHHFAGVEVLPTQVSYEHRERVVEKPVYIENIIERPVTVEVPTQIELVREVQRPVRVPVLIDRPVPVERTVYQEIEVPVENVVYRNIDIVVEKPVYLENLIELPVPVEVVVEKEIVIPVEHLVERPAYIENVVEKKVDFPVEVAVPYEQVTEEPLEAYHQVALEVEQAVAVPVERVVRKSVPVVRQVEVPYEAVVEKLNVVSVGQPIEQRMHRYVERPFERVIERPVYIERVIERPREVEKVVEIPLELVREVVRTVEKVVERPVYFDTVIEKRVEVIVERVVEVPVEKVIEVPITIYIDRPVINEVVREEEVAVESHPVHLHEEAETLAEEEFLDEEVEAEIALRKVELESAEEENSRLSTQADQLHKDLATLKEITSKYDEVTHFNLLAHYTDVVSRYNAALEYRMLLEAQVKRRRKVVEHQVNVDPCVEALKSRLSTLLLENGVLITQLNRKTSEVIGGLPRELLLQ